MPRFAEAGVRSKKEAGVEVVLEEHAVRINKDRIKKRFIKSPTCMDDTIKQKFPLPFDNGN